MQQLRVLLQRDLGPIKGITLSRSRIHELVKKNLFPSPFKLGEGWNAWFEHEIDEYLLERAKSRGFVATKATKGALKARRR
jgi:predicted DNA-binding transcriptional regulator AlpA